VAREIFRGLVLTSVAVCAAAAAGCGSLAVKKIAAVSQSPANVALYVDVHDGAGNAVPHLQEKDFRVYEDGKLLPAGKAKRALLEPKGLGARFVMVLVDLSGPVADSEQLPDLAAAVGKLVDRLSEREEVAVSIFDGNDEIAPFMGFGASSDGLVESIRKFRPRNRKTNWNGAVYQGLHTLEEKLDQSTAPEKSAALVVFTDRGTDLAQNVGVETLRQKVQESPVQIYVVAIGDKVNEKEINAIGRNGVFLSSDLKSYKKGFDEVAKKLTSDVDGRYVFSYCSPKRKGDHKAEIEIVAPGGAAKVSYKFSAAGFKSGCSPKRPPSFAIEGKKAAPAAPAKVGSEEEADDEDGGKPEKMARPQKAAERTSQEAEPDDAPRPAKSASAPRQVRDDE